MTELHGFELLWERDIPELDTSAKMFRHSRTGAELLSMHNDDENKVFGVTFRTLPNDSTGVPHILEHAVLSGSKKYPVRMPFLEMVKGSLHTFLNAMTYPDKTVYPVASTNRQDFYNLADVYMDAVFHPNITPEVLMREGWHYEFDDNGAMIFKGVVFNEMKGAYSSPDGLMGRWSQQALYPDTVYGVDSGGDPAEIPNLTYEQFREFYETFYHPSNARIWFYGDDDLESRLAFVNNVLQEFDYHEINADIALQEVFDEPRRVVYPYDASESEDEDPKALVTVNWLLPDPLDPVRTMSFSLMSRLLLSNSASPLQKALIDSDMGEEVIGGGLSQQFRQMNFSVGLRGVQLGDSGMVEDVVMNALNHIVSEGIDPDQIEAVLNTYEFRLREMSVGGGFPKGLLMLFGALTTWLYDGDPIDGIAFEASLAAVKQAIADNPRFFEDMIQEYLIDNMHRVTVLLKPDETYAEQLGQAERDRLDETRSEMNDDAVQTVQSEAERLIAMQQTPDSPEALATIPRLTLADLDREIKLIPKAEQTIAGVPTLYHDLHTTGIFYVDVAFDMFALPQELLPYYSVFEAALIDMGTTQSDFVKFSNRIGKHTGGISPRTFVSHSKALQTDMAYAVLSGKATKENIDELLDIMRETLVDVNLNDRDRFRQIVLEMRSGFEAGIIPAGHAISAGRAKSHLALDAWIEEQIDGVDNLFFLRRLVNEVDTNWEAVHDKLVQVRDLLLNRNTMMLNVTTDVETYGSAQASLAAFVDAFPANDVVRHTWSKAALPPHEGLSIPAQVNYVAKAGNLFDVGYGGNGASLVINRFIGLNHLWNEIRLQGGAYGAGTSFDTDNGLFTFWSYRDPNLDRTLGVYDATPAWLRGETIDESVLTTAIIGTISDLDQPQTPQAKGYRSLIQHWLGISDAFRQQRRDEVLGTTAQHFVEFADVLEAMLNNTETVVIGSEQAIDGAAASLQKVRLL